VEYQNVPRSIGVLLSHKAATLHELQTVYSLEDVYDMIEIIQVDNHNQNLLQRAAERGK
jgi:4-diphosphocytidyl-2C-methyl-D-erythritol kinase